MVSDPNEKEPKDALDSVEVDSTDAPQVDPINSAVTEAQVEIDNKEPELPSTPEAPSKEQDLNDQDANKDEISKEAKADSTVQQDYEAPEFWSANNKKAFAKAPAEIKKAVSEEVQRVYEWANGLASEVQQAKSLQKEVDTFIAPYEKDLKAKGVSKTAALKNSFEWAVRLEDPEIRNATFRNLLATYGMTPADLMGEDAALDEPYRDPRIDEVQQELAATREELSTLQAERKAQAQGHQVSQLQAEIDAFKSETDSDGKLIRPYINEFEDAIGAIVSRIRATSDGLTNYQILDAAYKEFEEKINQHIVKPNATLSQQQAQAENARRAKQAKAAISATPKSSSTGTPRAKFRPKGNRDLIAEAMDEAASELNFM